jgi:hypothetical protein
MPDGFRLLATPWWVNLLILVPVLSYWLWRRTGLALTGRILAAGTVFGLAFGFVESAVVVYLRAAIGLVPTPADSTPPPLLLDDIPRHLLATEMVREAATILMLVSVALLAARKTPERWAVFLYVFALWDLAYYAGLRLVIGWPSSLLTDDILFLLPSPWISDVWFPVLVSSVTVLAVLLANRGGPGTPR